MFTSTRYSYMALKIGLAAVFLWFGIDKFIHPSYWTNAWAGPHVITLTRLSGLTVSQLIYLTGIFEVLIGLSLITGVLIKFFSILATVFLIITMFFFGINEVMMRNIGLGGGLAALALWPNNRSRF